MIATRLKSTVVSFALDSTNSVLVPFCCVSVTNRESNDWVTSASTVSCTITNGPITTAVPFVSKTRDAGYNYRVPTFSTRFVGSAFLEASVPSVVRLSTCTLSARITHLALRIHEIKISMQNERNGYPTGFPNDLKTYIDRLRFELRLTALHHELFHYVHRYSPQNGKCTWYCAYRTTWPRTATPIQKVCDCPQSYPVRPSYIHTPYRRQHHFTTTYPEIVHDLARRVRDRRIFLRCIRCHSLTERHATS